MQISSHRARLFIVVGFLTLVLTYALGGPPVKPTPVVFLHTGDDGLSEKLADQVESAFKASTDFIMTDRPKRGTLIVYIPTNVDWKKSDSRLKVFYSVKFSITTIKDSTVDSQMISKGAGSCWDDKLTDCAAQILKQALTAGRKSQ